MGDERRRERPAPLTSSPDQESPAAWLADGRIVVASFHGADRVPNWYAMNVDGVEIRSLRQLDGVSVGSIG
jgi:hypothetical protein